KWGLDTTRAVLSTDFDSDRRGRPRPPRRREERLMGLIPTIQLDGRSVAHRRRVADSASFAAKVIELSSWMMVLGTIRLICAWADYANVYWEASRLEPLSLRRLGWFFQENHPIVALGAAW